MIFEKAPHPPAFERQLKNIFKRFPNSRIEISECLEIEGLRKHLQIGDRLTGFGELDVRKIRLPIKKYNISKSKGLRIILLLTHSEEKTVIVPLVAYFKGDYTKESDYLFLIRKTLREI